MIKDLKKLYDINLSKFEEIVQKFPDDNFSKPLLISPNRLYQQQKMKVLIIGQQTYGWGKFGDAVEEGIKSYEKFNLGENYYSSPFWNVTRKVEHILTGDKLNCAWTNLSKFDVGRKKPQGRHQEAVSSVDNILIQEIDILNPNFVLFFTGWILDSRVKKIFPGIIFDKIKGYSDKELSRLKHSNLPENTYRTYHPRYLRQSGLEHKFIKFLESVKT